MPRVHRSTGSKNLERGPHLMRVGGGSKCGVPRDMEKKMVPILPLGGKH